MVTAKRLILTKMSEPYFKGFIPLEKFYNLVDIPRPSLRRTLAKHYLRKYTRFQRKQEYSVKDL